MTLFTVTELHYIDHVLEGVQPFIFVYESLDAAKAAAQEEADDQTLHYGLAIRPITWTANTDGSLHTGDDGNDGDRTEWLVTQTEVKR